VSANHGSKVGEQALRYFQVLFRIKEEVAGATTEERRRLRQRKSRRVATALHSWLLAQRQRVPDGSATAKAIDYSLKRWQALTRYIANGDVPISNNWVENQIRPIALGRSNWLLAGSLRAGKRGRCSHEPGALDQDQRPRSLCLPQGRAAAAADTAGQPGRRTPDSSLQAADGSTLTPFGGVKMTCPDAYDPAYGSRRPILH
jgi:hypothetical protein